MDLFTHSLRHEYSVAEIMAKLQLVLSSLVYLTDSIPLSIITISLYLKMCYEHKMMA